MLQKHRYHFANKGPYSETYGFSSTNVQMWELDHKKGWEPKNWCFWIVVLEIILRVPWTARRSNQSILKEINLEYWKDWCWSSNTSATWCDSLERLWCWERLKAKGGGRGRGWVKQHHWLNGHECEQTLGDSGGRRSLVCCSPWGWQRVGQDLATEQQLDSRVNPTCLRLGLLNW